MANNQVTKISDLINPQVMADMISAKIPSKIVVTPFAKVDTTLQGIPGDTITVPKYDYIGDAVEVAEGVEVDTTKLVTTTTTATVKKAMKAVSITDEAVLSGYGNPIGETNAQLALAIASKVDQDAMDALMGAKLAKDTGAKISYNGIVDVIDVFNEEVNTDIRALSQSGIKSVDYASGYKRRLDSSVRQNILWGIKECNQNSADIVGEQLGADGYEISYHSNPRDTHADMGGRRYAKGKKGVTVKGKYYPPFSEVEGLLKEYGCWHIKFSIFLGISVPTYSEKELREKKQRDKQTFEYEGKKYTGYEATQVQGKLESSMRRERELMQAFRAFGDKDSENEARTRLRHLTSQYASFSKAAGLSTKLERTRLAVSGKNSLTAAVNGGIIDMNRSVKRRKNNIGVFENLEIPMQKREVHRILNKYDISAKGLTLKIQRSEKMLALPFYGSTDYNNIGRIDLFPNAFVDEEQLVRTVVHEKCHVLQLKKHGKLYAQDNIALMEKQAERFENLFYNILKKRVK